MRSLAIRIVGVIGGQESSEEEMFLVRLNLSYPFSSVGTPANTLEAGFVSAAPFGVLLIFGDRSFAEIVPTIISSAAVYMVHLANWPASFHHEAGKSACQISDTIYFDLSISSGGNTTSAFVGPASIPARRSIWSNALSKLPRGGVVYEYYFCKLRRQIIVWVDPWCEALSSHAMTLLRSWLVRGRAASLAPFTPVNIMAN